MDDVQAIIGFLLCINYLFSRIVDKGNIFKLSRGDYAEDAQAALFNGEEITHDHKVC